MTIFEYPYVIITILSAVFLAMIFFGVHFTLKSVKTADGTVERDFCGMGKIENDFEKSENFGKIQSLMYISMSLDSVKRLYSESQAARLYEQIKKILFEKLCLDIGGEISVCGNGNFVALNGLGPGETERCIELCSEKINKICVEHSAVNVVRMHFGYICTSSNEISFQIAFERAKKALSIAEDKDILYYRWDNLSDREFEKKLKIENNIQNEIENNRFFLEYQPILDAKTNKVIGAEVLSRLNSPTEGILAPQLFLSAVNNVGLNQKFDYYIFEKNCKWISNAREKRVKYVYTINFSRHTLCDTNMVENITNIIKKYDIDYSCIAIEVLEDKTLNETERAQIARNLNGLADKGILILLDDFGKGHTGFEDLNDFDVSIVKIDKSITQNATNQKGFLILKTIIKIVHDLGSATLCEGVETEEQKKAALAAGCDMFQGYYFYHPIPVTKFEKLFEENCN